MNEDLTHWELSHKQTNKQAPYVSLFRI